MAYDYVDFTPQASTPGSPAKNEIYYKDSDDRLYYCTDGTGVGGGAYSTLAIIPVAATPSAARGRVYVDSDDQHLYVCTLA